MKQACRFALCFALVGATTCAVAQQIDFLTANCLIGYENDDNPQVCAEVDPETRDAVTEARSKWLRERNADAMKELQAACQTRLLRAYGNEKEIQDAKEEARKVRAYQKALFLRAPNRAEMVNCRAYAQDFAAGGPRIDIQRGLIEETRDSAARQVEWPNKASQGVRQACRKRRGKALDPVLRNQEVGVELRSGDSVAGDQL